ncbi:endonuclease/exonuclease/phosphatase family protein [bacterium]|nr:endonuclease/exonuclease/phosphatase family protein [candidate division CSSED10-310 bacterium]
MRYFAFISYLLTVLVTSSSAIADDTGLITIGTFNIQGFGEKLDPLRIANLAGYCRGIDVLAVQEVHSEGTESVAALAVALGPEYLWAVSDVTTWERFAFIWRPPVTLQQGPGLLDKPKLGRKPFFAVFKAGNFDFELMNLHLFFDGSKKTYPHTRMVEFKLLDDWLSYREDKELDLILVGDFNAPGLSYGYQFPAPSSSAYFFYEFLNRHAMISVTIDSEIPTSVMNPSIYDHIIFNPARYFTAEFAGRQTINVIHWDADWDQNKNGLLDWSEYEIARKAVSDHRIVTASFRIDCPDDDGIDEIQPDAVPSEKE